MSVLSCNRPGCEKVMCDTYVDNIGYVCEDCKIEFKEFVASCNVEPNTEGEIKRLLKEFMGSEKGTYAKGLEMTVDKFFEINTTNYYV